MRSRGVARALAKFAGSTAWAGWITAAVGLFWLNFAVVQFVTTRSHAADKLCQAEVLGWIPYWDQNRAIRSFRQNSDVIRHLSMFWYHLDRKGRVKPYTGARVDMSIVREAQAMGVKVLAIVANLTDEDDVERWDRARVRRSIGSKARRREHIADLVALARDQGFDGINIDYEALRPEDKELFSTFIRELGAALRAERKVLAIALHPKSANPNDQSAGSAAQDWQALQNDVDQLHFMTYGEHTADDAPGPIASTAWIARVLDHAIKDLAIDQNRIWFGIPLYAESWREACEEDCASEDLTYSDVARVFLEKGSKAHRDGQAGASFIKDRRGRTIWFEDAWSVAQKIAVARERGICRYAFWRLGGEDPKVWSVLRGE